jgi:fatty acid desaturase
MIAAATRETCRPDEWQGRLQPLVDAARVRELSRLRPHLTVFAFAFDYALMIGAAVLCEAHFSWPLYVLTVILIAARLNALGVLLHDAVHYRLFANRRANDVAGQILAGIPIFQSLTLYRRAHTAHHRHLMTREDPDLPLVPTDLPMSRARLLRELVLSVTGVYAIGLIRDRIRFSPPLGRAVLIGILAVWSAGVIAGNPIARVLALYWFVPLTTWLPFITRLRVWGEHYWPPGHAAEHPLANARTILPSWFDRVAITARNVGYHLTHHLYPSVPWYNLTVLHRELLKAHGYQEARIVRGYHGLALELLHGEFASNTSCHITNRL